MRLLIAVGAWLLFWPAATTNLFGDGLAGFVPESPAPRASLRDWLDGRFQSRAETWWRERFGMRFFFVKLDNQIRYWLYGKLDRGGSVVAGPGDWLFEKGYVAGYCREHPPSDESQVRADLAALRALQDALDARGVPLVLLITPSKAAVLPEHLPAEACAPHGGGGYDYDVYRPLLDEYGLRAVDGFALTVASEALWPELTLFARGGTHWNELGAYYSAAALLDAVRPLARVAIPPLLLEDVQVDERPNSYDRDLVSLQNLLFPDTRYPAVHTRIRMARDPERGVRVALVGMSFLEQIAAIFAASGGFERVDHYWYYQHERRDALGGGTTKLERDRLDWEREFLDADFVVVDLNMLHLQGEHVRRFAADGLARLGAGPE
jgi:hypothetical protein